MNVLICGSRSITDREWAYSQFNLYMYSLLLAGVAKEDVTIIEGEADGVDSLARDWAEAHKLNLIKCPADWKTYGKSAGFLRNEAMVEMCDQCLILWDGKSKGTQIDIDLCNKSQKPYKLVTKGED